MIKQTNASMKGQQVFVKSSTEFGAVPIPSEVHPGWAGDYKDTTTAPAGVVNACEFLTTARAQLTAVNDARQTPDPAMPEAAHILSVNEMTKRALQNISKEYDRARNALSRAEAYYTEKVQEAANLTPTHHAAEIRSVIRAMPVAERYAAVIAAMQNGDQETLSAVLSGPPIAVGLRQDQIENLRDMAARARAPNELAALEAVRKAQAATFAGFDAVLSVADEIGLEGRAKLLRERQAKAHEARKRVSLESEFNRTGF